MAYSPNPNLFNDAFGGGVRTGQSLLENIENRRKRSDLQKLSSMAANGETDPNKLSALLFQTGNPQSALQLLNRDYSREQDKLALEWKQIQHDATQRHRGVIENQGNRRISIAETSASRLPKPLTPSGRINFDRDNNHITPETASKLSAIATTPKGGMNFDEYGLKIGSAPSQKMKLLVAGGLDEEAAMKIVSGRVKTGTNPVTGQTSQIDMGTGTMTPLAGQEFTETSPPIASPVDQTGLYSQADDATGIAAGVRDVASNTLGQLPGVGGLFNAPDTAKAKNDFDLYRRDLIRSLALNPRFPIAEQKRIENIVPLGAFTSPATLKISLRNLDAELARVEQEVLSGVTDTNRSVKDRSADGRTLQSVRAARARLNVPDVNALNATKSKYGLE